MKYMPKDGKPKSRCALRLEDEIIEVLKVLGKKKDLGYQSMIRLILREYIERNL